MGQPLSRKRSKKEQGGDTHVTSPMKIGIPKRLRAVLTGKELPDPNFTVILQYFYRTFMTRPIAPVYTFRGRPGTAPAPGSRTGILQPFCSARSGTPYPRLICLPCPAYTGPGSGGPASLSVCLLRVVHPPPGELYADQSCRRNCVPAGLSHGGHTVAGQSAGLQSLLARDYPTKFWAGLRRGPGSLPRPL